MKKERDFIILNRETLRHRFIEANHTVCDKLRNTARENGEDYSPLHEMKDVLFGGCICMELEKILFEDDHTDNIPTESDVENENNTITL